MEEVNKSELAKIIGKSNSSLTKIIQEGVLNGCFTASGKIDLKKALIAIELAKGSDYIKTDENVQKEQIKSVTQLEIIQMVEREKGIKFERPQPNNIIMSMEQLSSGNIHNWVPSPIVTVENVKEYLENSFTDEEIEKAINEVNHEQRGYALYELLDMIIRDNTSTLKEVQYLFTMILRTFYSGQEIAFYMDCMFEDGI